MALLYGRAGRLNTKNAGFRPGQFIVLVGTFMYAYVIGSFAQMMSTITKDRNDFDQKMRSVQELMRAFEVPTAHPPLRVDGGTSMPQYGPL